MKLVEFIRESDGESVFINPDRIMSIDTQTKRGTSIHFTQDDYYVVQESPSEVKSKLEKG